jgi:hypothetical protein
VARPEYSEYFAGVTGERVDNDDVQDIVVKLEGGTHTLAASDFRKLEPLIDDAIRDAYLEAQRGWGANLHGLSTLNNLVRDLFRHADPPADHVSLTIPQLEAVILALKGLPVPDSPERPTDAQAPNEPIRVDSPSRLIIVLFKRNRRQMRVSLRRLVQATRHGPTVEP